MHPDTRIGRICLVTRRPQVLADFYRERLGLSLLAEEGRAVRLGTGERELVRLEAEPEALPRGRTAGLYHLALRVPDRPALAAALQRLLATRTPLEGAADHQVSEAVYLSDPDGNGIEIYRDRPRESWFFEDGTLRMGTDPLDVDGLLREAPGDAPMVPAGTELGHVHLRVRDLRRSEEFYTRALGFQLMLRFGPSAGFVSAGGYHHHVGFNTWSGPLEPAPERPAVGMRWFSIRLPGREATGREALEETVSRLAGYGVAVQRDGERAWVHDPSNIRILLENGGG